VWPAVCKRREMGAPGCNSPHLLGHSVKAPDGLIQTRSIYKEKRRLARKARFGRGDVNVRYVVQAMEQLFARSCVEERLLLDLLKRVLTANGGQIVPVLETKPKRCASRQERVSVKLVSKNPARGKCFLVAPAFAGKRE